MRRTRFARRPGAILVGATFVFLLAGPLAGPLAAQTPPPRDAVLAAARAIMEAARFCALVTLDDTGAPRVRTMDPFPPGDDMTVWLGTDRHSRKVTEIARDGRVALHYLAPGAAGYVSLLGRARLVDDEAEKAARWKPEWEAFYADRAGDYLLIEVVPERIEVVDYARGLVGDSATWEPPAVTFP